MGLWLVVVVGKSPCNVGLWLVVGKDPCNVGPRLVVGKALVMWDYGW